MTDKEGLIYVSMENLLNVVRDPNLKSHHMYAVDAICKIIEFEWDHCR